MGRARAFLGLGSNLGDRRRNIEAALGWLTAHQSVAVERATRFEETEPWGRGDQPAYLNAVAEVSVSLSPAELLVEIQRAERGLGRSPDGPRWGPRIIDIDILLYGDLVLDTAELIIPHPCLASRRFVLRQILELDEKKMHPRLELPLRGLLGAHRELQRALRRT